MGEGAQAPGPGSPSRKAVQTQVVFNRSRLPMALNDTGSALSAELQGHRLLAVAYGVVFAVGLAENVAAGSLLLARLRRSSPSAVLLLSMTAGGATFAGALPLRVHYHLCGGDWRFGELACRLSGGLYWAFTFLSAASLFCLCLDCHLALAHPFSRLRLRRGHWAAGSLLLWGLAVSVATPLAPPAPLSRTGPNNRTWCLETPAEEAGSRPHGAYAQVVGLLAPCALVLGGCPLLAWRMASGRRTRRCRRALRTLCFSMLVCALCFLPFALTRLLPRFSRLGYLRPAVLLLVSLGSCLSPLLGLPWLCRAGRRFWARLCPFRPKIYTIYDGRLGRSGQLGNAGESQAGGAGLCPQEAPPDPLSPTGAQDT
ncbi:P2Y purinoceptor 2-like [Gracilinanus agilis]|uniref:P2Y purinoceptor 2-like n=1 Tax=Gracilinanus agilis TaxID=191870 RepID=UPI001CFC772A|nr:P2Y purinoceptor 2-like [Gracilinanus agilis]